MKASGIGANGSHSEDYQSLPATAVVSRRAVRLARPGAIGGAVLQASRRNAGLTRRSLARIIGGTPAAVRHWEQGTFPLYAVDYGALRQLAEATAAGVEELLIAQQCDLLIMRMLTGDEDFADVPPVDEDNPCGETARELLRWAFTGQVPNRWRRLAPSRPLLAADDADRIACLARHLVVGSYGPELASYGAAILQCAAHAQPRLTRGVA
jgi:transcriptional regulator with XRE-family HTH domain